MKQFKYEQILHVCANVYRYFFNDRSSQIRIHIAIECGSGSATLVLPSGYCSFSECSPVSGWWMASSSLCCVLMKKMVMMMKRGMKLLSAVLGSVGDPVPVPHVLGPPGSGSIRRKYGSGSFPFLIEVLSGLKLCLQNKILI
jgi:hypothetical protein